MPAKPSSIWQIIRFQEICFTSLKSEVLQAADAELRNLPGWNDYMKLGMVDRPSMDDS